MASVYVSPKAVEDLDNIRDYIKEELKSPQAAKEVVLKIISAYEMLANFPEMGSCLETRDASLQCYRHVPAGNYIVFYRIEDDNVYVVRILHCLMDYVKILV